MNDFTKEELEELRQHDNMSDELHKKIQSMIDNYCDHELWKFIADGGMGFECTKCGLFNDFS